MLTTECTLQKSANEYVGGLRLSEKKFKNYKGSDQKVGKNVALSSQRSH